MGRFNRRLSTKIVDDERRILIIKPIGEKYEEICEAILWEFYS